MDEFLKSILMAGALNSFRADDNVTRQGVMNHQTSAHLMDLSFIRDATEMSIPESYAVQGLQHASTPRDAAAINLAARTPQAA